MVKIKTTVTTKKVYSTEGKSFWIEYSDSNKEDVKNLCGYALRDIERGEAPFQVMVSEGGIDFSFKVEDEATQTAYIEIFKQIVEDLK